jgi:hypothetical protein
MILASALTLAAYAQNGSKVAPVPGDPLEMVTGQVSAVDTAGRADALRLLEHARTQYGLKGARRAYDVKVTFTVNSGGQTALDGTWQMEDVFDPRQGLRWTATAPDGSTFTRISRNGMLYGQDAAAYVPLRLHEARAALFDPMPSLETVNRASIRSSTAIYNGAAVTCVLVAAPGSGSLAASGRRWEETEECIDPQSGSLQTHSQAPGRYYAYDYTNAPQIAGRVLPHQVIVSEGGRTVSTITVESLTELPAADPRWFQPTEEMTAKGRPAVLGGAQRISRTLAAGPPVAGDAVCVFGVVTASGQLMEAHSLQPANPNSAAAVAAARQMSFARPLTAGEQPRQYFVFVIERFAAGH